MENGEIEELIYNFIECNKESIEDEIHELIDCEILYLEKDKLDDTIIIKCGIEIYIDNLVKSLMVDLSNLFKYNKYITDKYINIQEHYTQEDDRGLIRDYIYFKIYL